MTIQDWLEKLISFDTTSRNSNMELINHVKDYLTGQGFECRVIKDPEEDKANLFATLPAANGSKEGGLVLSGHTDVVPVDGQAWDSEPFKLVEKSGNYYGRGTSDMKGFIAVVLALVPKFRDMNLNYPLHFAFSYDEEIGCRGAPFMITDIANTGYKPRACVVGEPTNMQPIVAHKGKQSYRCMVHGKASHSSLTNEGCNAIEYAARLICYIRQIAEEYKTNGPFDDAYDVPYTTLTTNLIQGGAASNIIPERCEFTFEFRNVSEDTPASIEEKIRVFIEHDLLQRMDKEHHGAEITLHRYAGAPGLAEVDTDIVKLVRKITEDETVRKAAYATEAGLFQREDIPSVLCGPGSIEQAHTPNEFVAKEQLAKCEDFLLRLVKEF